MNCEYIVNCATDIVKKYGNDPFFAATQCGAIVSFKDIGSLKGAFFGALPKPAIVISNSLDEVMQKTVCAHELGHFILHKNHNLSCENISFSLQSNTGIMEREANIFAAAFIIDHKKATSLLKDGYTLQQTASMLRVDVNLLMFLLNSMGVCDAPDSCFLK